MERDDRPATEPRGFATDSTVQGDVQVPASKSIAQRLLACAVVAHGTTEIEGLPQSDDVMHALRCARAAGATFPSDGKKDDLLATALLRRRGLGRLRGVPPMARERARPWCTLPVGESGTAARLFTAICALARPEGSGAEIVPSGTLARRSSRALFAALREAGVGVEHGGGTDHGWPALLTAADPGPEIVLYEPTSSQEVSGLLIALAARPQERRLVVDGTIPSHHYVNLTGTVLRDFGVTIRAEEVEIDTTVFTVKGPITAPSEPIEVERDASAASVALAAGILSGGAVRVPGVGTSSAQPDAGVLRAFRGFGIDTSAATSGALACSGPPTRGVQLDCSTIPDSAPVLAAIAAFVARHVGERTTLNGLHTLPGKESSRIEVLVRGLSALGYDVSGSDRFLDIGPGTFERPDRVVLDPADDHRMAFAFALLSLFEPGVRVANPDCVRKSWPRFWRDLERAGTTLLP